MTRIEERDLVDEIYKKNKIRNISWVSTVKEGKHLDDGNTSHVVRRRSK